MTTLEVIISDDSKANFILSLLREFRYVKVANVKENEQQVERDLLDFDKFDAETQHRIKTYFAAKKAGDSLKTISLEQILEDEL